MHWVWGFIVLCYCMCTSLLFQCELVQSQFSIPKRLFLSTNMLIILFLIFFKQCLTWHVNLCKSGKEQFVYTSTLQNRVRHLTV